MKKYAAIIGVIIFCLSNEWLYEKAFTGSFE